MLLCSSAGNIVQNDYYLLVPYTAITTPRFVSSNDIAEPPHIVMSTYLLRQKSSSLSAEHGITSGKKKKVDTYIVIIFDYTFISYYAHNIIFDYIQ